MDDSLGNKGENELPTIRPYCCQRYERIVDTNIKHLNININR
jgi:hypothetical protein